VDTVRKNAVMLHEVVITASPEQVAKMSKKEIIAYFNDAMKWGNKVHGGSKNLVGCSLHFDESNPHCHLLYTPIEKVDKKLKLNSRGLLGNIEERRHPTLTELKENSLAIAEAQAKIKAGDKNTKIPKALIPDKNNVFILKRSYERMSDYQTSFYEEVGKKHGLDRGIKKSITNATHTPIKQHHQELSKKVDELEVKLEGLTEKCSDTIIDHEDLLTELSGQYDAKKNDINGLESDIERLNEIRQSTKNMTLDALRKQIASIEQEQEYTRPRMGR
jgi:polyhydroxyalkanoate synthesis regulator phasin